MRLAPIALALLAGCAPAPPPPAVVSIPAVPVAAPSAPEPPPPPKEPERPHPPKDYVEMTPLRIEQGRGGAAVLLGDEAGRELLPIFIGGTEGLSIQLRMEKQHYARPLTHDLFDAALEELGGELWKVQIDELRAGTFIGQVFLRKGDRIVGLDARPSDAIALALGSRAPIYVARRVLDRAAVHPEDPSPLPATGPTPPASARPPASPGPTPPVAPRVRIKTQ